MQSEAGSRAGVQGGTACWLSVQVMPEAAVKSGLISDISCLQKKTFLALMFAIALCRAVETLLHLHVLFCFSPL